MIFVMWIHWAESKLSGLTTNAKRNLDSGKVTHSPAPKAILQLRKATIPAKSLNACVSNTLKGIEIYKLEIFMSQNCHHVETDCVQDHLSENLEEEEGNCVSQAMHIVEEKETRVGFVGPNAYM